MLSIVEKEAAALDMSCKIDGAGIPQLQQLLFERDTAAMILNAAKERCIMAEGEVEGLMAEMAGYMEEQSNLLHKENRRFVDRTPRAIEARRNVKRLKDALKISENMKAAKATESKAMAALQNAEQKLKEAQGPFLERLGKVLEDLNLQRCAYHGGALVGKDVYTLLTNHKRVAEVLKTIRVATSHGNTIIGSHRDCQRAETLLRKLHQMYQLAMLNRPLCKDEVQLLAIRASSFGSMPVNFPEEAVKPKLHMLVFHFPEKAEKQGSVALETEQLIEGVHPYFNAKGRQYATIRKTKTKASPHRQGPMGIQFSGVTTPSTLTITP